MNAIHVNGLAKNFTVGSANSAQELQVLESVSFNVREGEFVGILGPNGCGKSTLLKMVLGLLPPDAGEIRVMGAPAGQVDVAYVPQAANNSLYPWFTALENVAFARDASDQTRIESASAALADVGLSSFAHAYPYQLSGGMKQMVSIARASQHASVFLLDEPLNGLDYSNRLALERRLLLMRDKAHTVLLVSHDLESTLLLCDRIVVLSQKPTRVRAVLPVSLGKNRSHATRFSPEFNALLAKVHALIQEP